MQTDLLKTKAELLEGWCRQREFFSKADLMVYGTSTYYLRAWRTVCDWVVEGKARKLTEDERLFRGLRGRDGLVRVGGEIIA